MNSGGGGNFLFQMLVLGFGMAIGHYLVRRVFGGNQQKTQPNPYLNNQHALPNNHYQSKNPYQSNNPYQQSNPNQQETNYQSVYPRSSSYSNTPSSGPESMYDNLSSSLTGVGSNKKL